MQRAKSSLKFQNPLDKYKYKTRTWLSSEDFRLERQLEKVVNLKISLEGYFS